MNPPLRRSRLARLLACAALTLTTTADALAAPPTPPDPIPAPPPLPATSRDAPPELPDVRWRSHWREFGWGNAAATTSLVGVTVVTRFLLPGPSLDRTWRGTNGFDDAFVDAFSLRDDPDARRVVGDISDIALYGPIALRVLDSTLAPGLGHGDWKLASQMLLIDIEASAVFLALYATSQALTGRLRPRYADDCDAIDTDDGARCAGRDGSSHFQSFFGGHSGMAVTMAALTCLHHDRNPLYGGWGDGFACGAMVTLATVNTFGRLMADEHYATDLLAGIAVGLFSGWVVPSLLHYGWSEPDDEGRVTLDDPPARDDDDGRGLALGVAPTATDEGGGLVLVGAW